MRNMGPGLRFTDNTVWKDAYQRNNKSNGQKNLRCFPECTEGKGHRALFCGRSIKIEYFPEEGYREDDIALSQLSIDAEQTTSQQIHNLPTKVMLPYALHQLVSGHELRRLLRTKTSPMGELMPGRNCDSSSPECIAFEFNAELRGWHYGFVGNKGTRSIRHALYAYVFRRLDDKGRKPIDQEDMDPPIYDCTYKVVAVVRSPPWTISCRRRNKGTGELTVSQTDKTSIPAQSAPQPTVSNQVTHTIKAENESVYGHTHVDVKDEAGMQPLVDTTVKPVKKPTSRERVKFNVRRQESQERVAASGRSIYSSKRCIEALSPEPIQRQKSFEVEPSETANLQNVVFKLLTLVLLPNEGALDSTATVQLFSGHSPASFTLELIDILINWRQRTALKLHAVSEVICLQASTGATATCFSTHLLRQPRFWRAVDKFVEANELSSKLDPQSTTRFILRLLTHEYAAYKGIQRSKEEGAGSSLCTELSPLRSLPFVKSLVPQHAEYSSDKPGLKPACRQCTSPDQCTNPSICPSPLIGLKKSGEKPDLSFLCFEYQSKCVVDETEALLNHLLTPSAPPETPSSVLNNFLNLD